MPEIRRSVCALDCPDCCGLLATVENGRDVKLHGDPAIDRAFLRAFSDCARADRPVQQDNRPTPARPILEAGAGHGE
jgi:hypothetical protein